MRPLVVLALLVLLSAGVQTWCVTRAAVPAQDAVRYVAIAQSIEQHGLIATWREHSEHPLFPALVFAMHGIGQRIAPETCSWCAAAQAASALMLVLAVVPVFFLLRRLVEATAATAGTVFFCLLPEVARLGADALSDSTHLLLVCIALWAVACHWRTRPHEVRVAEARGPNRAGWLFISGAALGLAMLARPEAVVAAGTMAAALVWFQMRRSTRRPWLVWGGSIGCLSAGLLIVTPYLVIATSGRVADMPSRLLGRDTPSSNALTLADVKSPVAATTWRFSNGEVMAFGAKDSSVSSRFRGYRGALGELARELPSAFQYWIGALALIGMAALARRPQRRFDRFAQGLFALHLVAAVLLAAQLGYLSTRHLLTLVVLGLPAAGWGACVVGRVLAEGRWPLGTWLSARTYAAQWVTALVVVSSTTACLPETLGVLHASRSGHRQAGEWLATAALPGLVLDTRGWTGLYSGRETLRYDMAKLAYRRSDLAYVVLEQREVTLDSPRGRTLRHLLAGAAEPVASFAAPRGKPADTVLIYRWRAERFTENLRTGQSKI